jgi:alkylhydroperoxidase/carboxymuconolactone decarboxylase family protein YurZ
MVLPQPLNSITLEHFTMHAYGYVCAFLEVTSAKETSFAMISALVANDTPRQAEWHLAGAIRNGATYEETRAVREIALRIAMKAGVLLKHSVPNI